MNRTVVVLAQLGTPDAPTAPAVRRYLREFLSDPRVVDLPRFLWLPILYGPVLTFRPAKTAELYRRVWTAEGSPLLHLSLRLRDALRAQLPVPVELGMRYGNPSLRDLLAASAGAADRILLVPLFPQYAEATTGSVVALAREVVGDATPLDVLDPLYESPSYIQALVGTVREAVAAHGEPERWLVSFHGLPQRQVRRGDPYPVHCERTAHLLAEGAGWEPGRWTMTYQSRFGPGEWLNPYTDKELERMGRAGVSSLGVLCPGFAADCLETLDEIADLGKQQFQGAGGGEMFTVPCLNDTPAWVAALREAIEARF